MKKIYLLLFLFAMVLTVANAQVAFLLRTANISDLPAENFNSVDQKPEQNAANWFENTYSATDKTVLSIAQVKAGALLTAGEPAFKALWVNVDAVGLSDLNAAGIDNDVVLAIKAYVQAGGNLLLTKQATTLAYSIGRINYAPDWANGGYAVGGDTWSINPHIAIDISHADRSGHSAFIALETIGTYEYTTYPLVGADPRTDNNNNFEPMKRRDGSVQENGENTKLANYESDWNCQILATWGHVKDVCVPGLMEFFPDGDFKGTIIVNGLSAYQWGTSNSRLDNVKLLTANTLNYLSQRATATWTVAPKANPVIKDEEDVTVVAGSYSTVNVATSNPDIANYHEGHIYYNFFGDVTFTATATGDGIHTPKNAVLYPQVRTVTGGTPATYGYILPFSINTISASGYNSDGTYLPDYLATLWFYNEYVSQGNGCFINPAEASIPSAVKVLWINSDKSGLSDTSFDEAYAGSAFVTALTDYVNAGGNLFLSKQAVRMLRKLHRYENGEFPIYSNGGYGDNNDDWKIRNTFFAGSDEVDYSSHSVYQSLGSPVTLISGGGSHNHRTDNNNLIYNNVFNDKASMQSFETTHNCRILGTWPNAADNKCDAGVFVEFLPQTSTAGTIIGMGAAAYQWNDRGTINLENVHPNIKTLTGNILTYLSSLTEYTRTVTQGNFGTICLPRASASTSGATFYRLVGKIVDGSSNPTEAVIEEVQSLQAGVPYIFEASANQIAVTYTGTSVLSPDNSSSNGLIGSFVQALIEDNSNHYILSSNTLYQVNQSYVGANRAYFDLSAMPLYDPSAPVLAPQRRMSIYAPHLPTATDEQKVGAEHTAKQLENGSLYIIKDGKKYNTQGQRVQ